MLTGVITPRRILEGVWERSEVETSAGDHIYRQVMLSGRYGDISTVNGTVQCIGTASLSFDGTQYVMTDYCPNQNTKIELLFQRNDSTQEQFLYGTRRCPSAEQESFWLSWSAEGTRAGFGTEQAVTAQVLSAEANHVLTADNNAVQSEAYPLLTFGSTADFTGEALCIGGLHHRQTTDERLFQGTLQYVRVYEGSTLVRSYVPAQCGDVKGLYELLNRRFWPQESVTGSQASRFGALPLCFSTTGTQLTDYVISGHTGGVGDYDESRQQYKMPVTVRSKNRFDKDHAEIVRLYPKQADGIAAAAEVSWSLVVKAEPNTTYSFSMYHPVGTNYRNRMNIGCYAAYPQAGSATLSLDTTSSRDGDYVVNTFTTAAQTQYLLIFLWSDQSYTETAVRTIIEQSEMQLEEGTARTAYEPYFYSETDIWLEEPLGAGDSVSLADTLEDILTSDRAVNTLTVDTQVQPSVVYIAYAT